MVAARGSGCNRVGTPRPTARASFSESATEGAQLESNPQPQHPLNGLIPVLLSDLYQRAIDLARQDGINLGNIAGPAPARFATAANALEAEIDENQHGDRALAALNMLRALARFIGQIEALPPNVSREQLSLLLVGMFDVGECAGLMAASKAAVFETAGKRAKQSAGARQDMAA
jgi:hypothetical protein